MRLTGFVLCTVLFAFISASASTLSDARTAATNALNFKQGDRQRFADVRALFTDEGWTDFMKTMTGFLDASGAPTFTSTFVPSGEGRIVGEDNGLTHVRVPGTWTQTSKISKVTYQIAVDVWGSGTPFKIQRLNETTCLGASTACQ